MLVLILKSYKCVRWLIYACMITHLFTTQSNNTTHGLRIDKNKKINNECSLVSGCCSILRNQRHTREPNNLRVGSQFLYGYNHGYIVENGEVTVSHCLPPTVQFQCNENERTGKMAFKLQEHYNITVGGRDSNHFSPFSGGGDIVIFKKSAMSATVVGTDNLGVDIEDSGGPEGQDMVDTNITAPDDLGAGGCEGQDMVDPIPITPPKQNEFRCGSLEAKVSSVQSEDDVILQLQANMVLTCSVLLKRKIEMVTSTTELEQIDTLTCYGTIIGPTYSLSLLQLTIDFEDSKFQFEELFKLRPCVLYPAYIDITMNHIFECL